MKLYYYSLSLALLMATLVLPSLAHKVRGVKGLKAAAADQAAVDDAAVEKGIPRELIGGPRNKPKEKAICHKTKGKNDYILISVADAAYKSHIKHGDGPVYGQVPGKIGYRFGDNCELLPGSKR
jgi:hypothetical protein